jgi:hypothetical protein
MFGRLVANPILEWQSRFRVVFHCSEEAPEYRHVLLRFPTSVPATNPHLESMLEKQSSAVEAKWG